MKSILHYLFCGLAMGAADVVPGVSGGTIAFIVGIYPRLLRAVEAFNLRFVRLLLQRRVREALSLIPWDFLLPLLSGIAISIFTLARFVTYVLTAWPVVVWSFFVGLILASGVLLGKDLERSKGATWLGLALGIASGWAIGAASVVDIGQSLPIYFASGFIAICAMILPGISGSFILVLLGQYAHVIKAVAELDFPVLIVFALGCACGLISFARVVNRLLAARPYGIMGFLTGLMLGSIRAIWPWKTDGVPGLPAVFDAELLLALSVCLVGVAIPIVLHWVATRNPGRT